jgi:hypothetical protein
MSADFEEFEQIARRSRFGKRMTENEHESILFFYQTLTMQSSEGCMFVFIEESGKITRSGG